MRTQSRYDAAQTNDDNQRHWANADSLDPNAANTPEIRRRLRDRARYEEANNSYLSGLLQSIANEKIGTGPRLQLRLEDRRAARTIERAFGSWSRSVNLAEKLWLLDLMQLREGEGFGILVNNPGLPVGSVQLDLQTYEADQFASPDLSSESKDAVDGIRFDKWGNPIEYHLLKNHPGSNSWANLFGSEYEPIPAKYVLHYFLAKRAGQRRGIPPICSALPLFAQLRRYTLATIGAAELAASIAAIMETDQAAPNETDSGAAGPALMQRIYFDKVAMLSVPKDWSAKGFDSKQPVQTYGEFKGEVIDESGRSVLAPSNISRGSSARYNFSSGKLDRLQFESMLKIGRFRIGIRLLDRILRAWLDEALFVPGLIPDGLPPFAVWEWRWFWDGFGAIDEVKDRVAKQIGLQSGQLNLDDVLGGEGKDWEEFLEQRQREMLKCKALGLPSPFSSGGVQIAEVYDKDPATGPALDPEPVPEEV